jgi:uncharacterized membrane protein
VTEFVSKNYREPMAVALYGLDLTFCSSAFYLLRMELIRQSRHDSALTEYHQRINRKGAFAAALYLLSVPLAYVSIYASFFIFVLVPAMFSCRKRCWRAASSARTVFSHPQRLVRSLWN